MKVTRKREGENKIDMFDLVDGNEEEEEEKEEIIKIPLDTRYLIVLEETLRCIFFVSFSDQIRSSMIGMKKASLLFRRSTDKQVQK